MSGFRGIAISWPPSRLSGRVSHRRTFHGAEINLRRKHLDQVTDHWASTDPDVSNVFYGWPPLRPYFHRCITGEAPTDPLDRDWLERWVVDRYLGDVRPVESCVSLCCGFGEIERILARLGTFGHCTGIDVAEGALQVARARATHEGLTHINYVQADINELQLEPNSCDLVWANGAFHHLTNLEHVTAEVYRALKPGGVLVANEYVGPDHQTLGPRQLELVNSVIHLIPRRLRDQTEDTFIPPTFKGPLWLNRVYRLATGKRFEIEQARDRTRLPMRTFNGYRALLSRLRQRRFRYGKVWDIDRWYFRHVDPSEAVRASDIIPVLRKRFNDMEVRPYNGSVLLYALDSVFRENFDPTSGEDVRLLEMLTDIEEALIAAGELEADHALMIARKPS